MLAAGRQDARLPQYQDDPRLADRARAGGRRPHHAVAHGRPIRPLTAEEKEKGRWTDPNERILFEGTLEEAEEFYEQTEIIPPLENTPYCKYTDGLPIVVPTEERVAEMLKGTSHKPDEVITFHARPPARRPVSPDGQLRQEGRPVAASCRCGGRPRWRRSPPSA